MATVDRPRPPLGEALEAARQAAGLSQNEAASRAGVTSGTWGTAVRGGRQIKGMGFDQITPKPDTVAKMAVAVGLNVKHALRLAGYTPTDLSPTVDRRQIKYDLSFIPDDQLNAEVRRREQRKQAEGGDTPKP